MSKTKIVCTIGPASWDPQIIKKMIENGMDCARVNGAFADPEELDKVKSLIREFSNDVSLMLDVKGPEVRLNKFANAKEINPTDEIIIGNDESDEIYPANFKDVYSFVKKGQSIVVGDGDVELFIKEIKDKKIICEVVYGQVLKPGKALNFPGMTVSTDVLTDQDKINIEHAKKTDWDFVSASFIQNADSAKEINKRLEGSNLKLIAKIEDQNGIDNIDEILEEVYGIMVARGGLGVELGLEKVPAVTELLTKKANESGKPVITATQMLESMTANPRPTRAEVNDVADAVSQGTDAVMLSAESASGKYPAEAVAELETIARESEKAIEPLIIDDGVASAVTELCLDTDQGITKVFVLSKSGEDAKLIGRNRVKQEVYAFVENEFDVRTLTLSKGIVKSFVYNSLEGDRESKIGNLIGFAKEKGIAVSKDVILVVLEIDEGNPELFEIVRI